MGERFRLLPRKGTDMITYRMADILPLLGLPEPPQYRRDYYIACPNCDNEQGKHLNIHLEKDVFRCPRCDSKGGVFDLYALFTAVVKMLRAAGFACAGDAYHRTSAIGTEQRPT